VAPRAAAKWENLSASQRARYLSAGRSGRLTGKAGLSAAQTRRYYLNGGLMAGGRGHVSKTPISPKAKSRPKPQPRKSPQRGPRTTPKAKAPKTEAGRSWDNLSASQKKRYLSAGKNKLGLNEAETRAYYESGQDLRELRGHKPERARGAAPLAVTEKLRAGELLNDADRQALRDWRDSSRAPAWLPGRDEMGDDTAALLSQVSQGPSSWQKVSVVFNPDNTVTITITPKNGYPSVMTFPDQESAYEVLNMVRTMSHVGLDVKVDGSPKMGPKNAIAA